MTPAGQRPVNPVPRGPKPEFKDALDICAYYLNYPKVLVDWLRARGYNGQFWRSK